MNGGQLVSWGEFSCKTPGVFDPTVYELLIQVEDQGMPVRSTTTTVIVHVVPWTTTVPTTTTTTTTTTRPPRAAVVRVVVWKWSPQPWFVVVLTASGALLLLLSLTLLLWRLISAYRQAPEVAAMPLLQDRHENFDRVSDQSVE
ncbi:hypothetical protein MATL_G00107070 [Megalops atlanticus]|uniref:Cadherin-related family member 4 n=1 Tax=Megalops atlanticus TaxID=7932 RepID=A0A9D3Q056_MEGAT|nr:hypothetical protein MATL_G00107070 [Megalops atlanticus]